MSALIRGAVKSVQRGTASGLASSTLNVTVSSVVMTKSTLNILGQRFDSGGIGVSDLPFLAQLTSSTNIQITPSVGAGGAVMRLVSWELIEYY